MSEPNSTEPAVPSKPSKPAKPYPAFPLTAHSAGVWCKKIRGRIYYFGSWSDPDAALAKYLDQKDALHAGRTPRPDPETLTVKDIANAFLNAKQEAVDAGELSPRTWADYRNIMDRMVEGLGKHRPVADLRPNDFAALKNQLAKRNGPPRMAVVVQVIRSAFKHAYDAELLDRPMRFGPSFKRPSKKTLRLHRAKQGVRLFTQEEIKSMLVAATVPMRAMILLAINCGYGNNDCANLPRSALDLETGWAVFPRPKTGVPRRCPLWPESIAALQHALAQRPEAKDPEDADLVFITRFGRGWSADAHGTQVTLEMRKLMRKVGINGHRNFYVLRHTHRTIADEAKDQPASNAVMGHDDGSMANAYRERISDERLKAVTDHVRGWLFGSVE